MIAEVRRALFFSDIEGSTRIVAALGTAWPGVLYRHRAIVRAALAAHRGVEHGIEGDSFFAVFDSADDAVGAAVEVQLALGREPWPPHGRIRVRIGIHVGEVHTAEEGVHGLAVHHAARVAAAAHGGQIVVTEHCLAELSRAGNVVVDALGRHGLRDVDGGVELYQVVQPGLTRDFPRLRTQQVARHNLPAPADPLVGREQALRDVLDLIESRRVVTLTGAGGCGKTRLAIEAARLSADRRSRTCLVVLDTETSAAEIPQRVLRALRATGDANASTGQTIDQIVEQIGNADLLLLLDNCEHLLPDIGWHVGELVARCPNLSVLTTSRERIGVVGEHVWVVPSLTLPDIGEADLFESAAAQLFLLRAKAADDGFVLAPVDHHHVAAICRRLDGIPLALELAAARCAALDIAELAKRLEGSLGVLATARTAVPRQQTLDATIDWSFQLLDDSERDLLCRLSVFRGGANLDAVEAVARADPIEAIAALVGKSLVVKDRVLGSSRYRLLEPIRQFASTQPAQRAAAEDARRRHLRHFVALSRDVHETIERADLAPGQESMIELELDNIVAAQEWGLAHDFVDEAAALAVDLFPILMHRAEDIAGRMLRSAVSDTSLPVSVRVELLADLASIAQTLDDAESTVASGLGIAENDVQRARIEAAAAISRSSWSPDVAVELAALRNARTHLDELPRGWLRSLNNTTEGYLLSRLGRLTEARQALEAAASATRLPAGQVALAGYLLALLAQRSRDVDAARRAYLQHIADWGGSTAARSWAYLWLALIERADGQLGDALHHARYGAELEQRRGVAGNVDLPVVIAVRGLLEEDTGAAVVADSLFAEARRLAELAGTHLALGFTHLLRAIVRARRGDVRGAGNDRTLAEQHGIRGFDDIIVQSLVSELDDAIEHQTGTAAHH